MATINVGEYPAKAYGISMYVFCREENPNIENLKKLVYNELEGDPHVVVEDNITIITIPKSKLPEFLKNEQVGYFRYDGKCLKFIPHPKDIKHAKKLIDMGLEKVVVYSDDIEYPNSCDLYFTNGITLRDVNIKSVPFYALLLLFSDKVEIK